MADFFTTEGPIRLGETAGSGGQGSVYKLVGQPSLLVKVFNDNEKNNFAEKLLWMKENPPRDPTAALGHVSIAWVVDVVYRNDGRICGYLMPYIQNAASLLQVFNPLSRTKTLPDFNWMYLHRTARNLAVGVAALHEYGYVIGDLNESNVMVTPSAMVSLIDCDSFQVMGDNKTGIPAFLCPVGKPEYTAPELQGKDFAVTVRSQETDRFALGVLIFQLLIHGNHPFRSKWRGKGESPSLEEKIQRGCFAYQKIPPCPVIPPVGSLSMDILHPSLAVLFKNCFVDGHFSPAVRPTAQMWELAIRDAEKDLIKCDAGHYFSSHLGSCPWCEMPFFNPRRALSICPACKRTNPPGTIYCQQCSKQLCEDKRCNACGLATPAWGKYCIHCGLIS